MKKNHIKAIFKEITGYIDPAPALKNNMQKWRKPGLYSSISQNIMLTAACTDKRSINLDEYLKAVKNTPEVSGAEFSIFRDPGEAEKNFIFRVKSGENSHHHYNMPCSRLIPPVLPLLLVKNENEHLISAVKYILLSTRDSSTIACSILFLQLIKDLIQKTGPSILKIALHSAEKSVKDIISNQDRIFECGLNPDYIISEAESLHKLFKELNNNKNTSDYEKLICSHADRKKTDTITRASVNFPETILPLAVVLSDSCPDPEKIFYIAAQEGGSSSSLTSISASITTAFHGVHIPEDLSDSLINKKKVHSIIDLIGLDKTRTSIITEIYDTEPGLTAKEIEEYKSKNKNVPAAKVQKKFKNRGEIESQLSKHVVESWTKIDKAKWKKERKKENS